jgi:Ras-related C3 botulinum toxin substrate 1
MNSVKTVKMVLVGDSCVGKTSLLFTYVHNRFPEEYVPTVFENHISTLKVDDKIVSLSLWDTAGQ